MSTRLVSPSRLEVGFFDRSVHDVAHDLIGCGLLHDGVGVAAGAAVGAAAG